MTKVNRFDTVTLRESIGAFGKGEKGAVVKVYTAPYEAYDIEMVADDGTTSADERVSRAWRIFDAHAQLQVDWGSPKCLALDPDEGDLAVFEKRHVLRPEVNAFRRKFCTAKPLHLRGLLALNAARILQVEEIHVAATDDLVRVVELDTVSRQHVDECMMDERGTELALECGSVWGGSRGWAIAHTRPEPQPANSDFSRIPVRT